MRLSPELQTRADAIIKQPSYHGPDLSSKIVIAIEGPFGIGKSTLSNTCISLLRSRGINAGIIGSSNTRASRPDDPESYTCEIDPETLIRRGENGELIKLIQHPTGHLYATAAEDVSHDVNIGPLMPEAVQKFKLAGFKDVFAFYLTAPPEVWQRQLEADSRLSRPDTPGRIEEAITSLEYAISTTENLSRGPLALVSNDGQQPTEDLAAHILHRAGFKDFDNAAGYKVNYLREMYNYALFLQHHAEEA